MANKTFSLRYSLEKSVIDLAFKLKYAETSPTAILATTAPIELTKVATGTAINGYTVETAIDAAAANPTDTILADVTGTAAATVITITPNDGTNNPTAQAEGILDLTDDIVLTKTVAARPGVDGNGDTFELVVDAAAANPTDTVLADVTGTAAATVITITPNDGTNNPTVQAYGSLATTTPIVLTKTVLDAPGVIGNGYTLELVVNAAAANASDTVIVDLAGTADAIVITLTPNDGTNNGATPVNVTTAELVELINTGVILTKSPVLTGVTTLLDDQTATGGDATNLANGGEGDGLIATFANGANTAVTITTANLVTLINSGSYGTVTLTDTGSLLDDQTATGGGATDLANGGEGDGAIATFAGGENTAITLTSAELVELINSGTVAAKSVTLTDTGSLLNDQTATGGDTTDLVNGGEGDGLTATFAGAVDFTFIKKYGLKDAYLTAPGTVRLELTDRYYEFLFLSGLIKDTTERDITFQLKANDVNSATIPYVDFYTLTAGSATTVAANAEIWLALTLKNTSAI